nr:putative late blight resistance protein homolog R1A-10 [Ipomoea batatas]
MARIPNVKKLGVRYEKLKRGDNMHPIDLLHTLSHLEQLENIRFYGYESLKYSGLVYIPKPYDFPRKLKKLKFFKTWMKLGITMTILGRLPNLEVLQLKRDAFDDSEMEWEQVEEGFPKLKVLVFEDQGRLCRWIDSDFTFPSLECLVLNNSGLLESLPYECLSGCPCLKLIHLKRGCSDGVLESSKKIQNDGDGLLEVNSLLYLGGHHLQFHLGRPSVLGRLPNLEVLHLKLRAFDVSETKWEQVKEGFSKLKVFEEQYFYRWKDRDFTFPSLECLVLKNSSVLESLPYECLSGCPCLKLIHLEGSYSYGVLESAKKIQNDGVGQLEDDEENLILENLTTLLWLSDFCCKNEALMVRIPNVKKLGDSSKHPIDLLHTLSHLKQLENIKFYGDEWLKEIGLVYIPKPYDFPRNLKKLKFVRTWMKLEIMPILGRLPNLQVLQLKRDAFDDSETVGTS